MDFREFDTDLSEMTYTVTLSLSVENMTALWNAAAAHALAAPGMTLADVLDTIGPREDPSIADCITMLAVPHALAGCAIEDVTVREVAQPATMPIQLLPLAARGAASPRRAAAHR